MSRVDPGGRLGADLEAIETWAGSRVLVFGDAILDRYYHGQVNRISPEAPVPVVRLDKEEARLGGAANVVANLARLGGEPRFVTVVGDDDEGGRLRELLRATGVDDSGLVVEPGRASTSKARLLARRQQVARLDRESDGPLRAATAAAVLDRALAALDEVDGVVVSDYAKGLIDGRTLAPLLVAARERGLPVVIDPKVRNFELYAPATLLTPNLQETASLTAREFDGDETIASAAAEILARLGVDGVLVTLGERGMLLCMRGAEPEKIEAHAREVYDVTGAGDTVAATLGLGLSAGLEPLRVARWANAAGALAVGHSGTAAVSREELELAVREARL